MWSDRLERIAACTDALEWAREQRKKRLTGLDAVINQIGECDQLEELHRLLYDWEEA